MADPTRTALFLSYALSDRTERRPFVEAANEALRSIVPVDSLGWIGMAAGTFDTTVIGTDNSDRKEVVQAVQRSAPQHPMFLSYARNPLSVTPRRMSDLLSWRQWRSHPVFSEVFVPLGATSQLTVMVRPLATGSIQGWALHRRTQDFTDDEVDTVTRLQPMLSVLNTMSLLLPGGASRGEQDLLRDVWHLTPREAEVLQLLAHGFDTVAIARLLRVSARTVQKHIENTYAKLGCHDRVGALREAVRRGVLDASVLAGRRPEPPPLPAAMEIPLP